MAVTTFRVNLNAAKFPLVSRYMGQSIIIRETDTNYVPTLVAKSDDDKDIGIPQIYFVQNVMPTSEGICSVAYRNKIAAISGVSNISQVFTIRNAAGDVALLALATNGNIYRAREGATAWTAMTPIAGTAGKKVTVAFVSGVTYIYFENVGCYTYDFTTNQLVSQTLTGLTAADIIGIIGSSGYLIAWSMDAIAWSSTVDPTDFVPDLVTGAGGGGVENAKGELTVLVPTLSGFIVYTTTNAVAAAYSGNARFPFNFREVVGCGGLLDSELAASDGNAGVQYVYTLSGLQTVSFQQAQAVLPEITDFISGSFMEDFNYSTEEFTYTELTAPMKKKVLLLLGRYLIISYGVSELTHALIYDLGLKRYGKIKQTHVDAFDYSTFDVTTETAKQSIALLKKDGSVVTLNTDFLESSAEAVVITGKYQLKRSRLLQVNEVTIENTSEVENEFTCRLLTSYSGSSVDSSNAGYLATLNDNYRKYLFSAVGINHSLLMKGTFNLNTVVMNTNVHGRV